MGIYISFHSIKLKLDYNREIKLQKLKQSYILPKEMFYTVRINSLPNLRSTRESCSFCEFMSNSVAIPFQVLEGAPGERG